MPSNRQLVWHDQLFDETLANNAQKGFDMTPALAVNERLGCTITRIIGTIYCSLGVTIAGDAVQVIDVGIGVIERDAQAANAFPDPDTEADQPGRGWMYRARELCFQETGVPFVSHAVFRFDIRAQRRLDRGMLMLIIDNNSTEGTPQSVVLRGLTRSLCRLP